MNSKQLHNSREDFPLTEAGDAAYFDLFTAARMLGSISPWTLRKHIAQGTVKATRLGRRVFVPGEEIERIRTQGLPSLRPAGAMRARTRTRSGSASRRRGE